MTYAIIFENLFINSFKSSLFYMLVIERLIFLHCVDADLRRSRPAVRNVMLGNADTPPPPPPHQGMRIRMSFEVVRPQGKLGVQCTLPY